MQVTNKWLSNYSFLFITENDFKYVDISISQIPRDSGSSQPKQRIIYISNLLAFEENDICAIFFLSKHINFYLG